METSQLLTSSDRPESTDKVRVMFDAIASRYDLLNTVLSGGLHRLWERRLVGALPEEPSDRCLDLCTGTGALVPRLAPRYREVVGVDISAEMLRVAQARWGTIKNATWHEGDAQRLQFADDEFDCVTVAYGVRNWPEYKRGLSEVYRVLRPGGSLGILEFGQPHNAVWRAFFNLYSRYAIPTLGAIISGHRAPYEYLPKTAATFPCGAELVSVLQEVGFPCARAFPLAGGVAYIYIARKD